MAEEQTITNCTFRLDKSDESNRLSSMGEESEKKWIYVYVQLDHFAE